MPQYQYDFAAAAANKAKARDMRGTLFSRIKINDNRQRDMYI